jgi:hypothetical protein
VLNGGSRAQPLFTTSQIKITIIDERNETSVCMINSSDFQQWICEGEKLRENKIEENISSATWEEMILVVLTCY